jgi:hypothetical protein
MLEHLQESFGVALMHEVPGCNGLIIHQYRFRGIFIKWSHFLTRNPRASGKVGCTLRAINQIILILIK